jgi:cyclopropane-fatty-acyl-phospholipid synthase
LPIKQIYKKKKLFFEKYVTLSNDNKGVKFLHKKANNSLIKRIQNLNLISVGNTIEYPLVALKFLETIAKKIKELDGGLLTFDYGYNTKKNQNTLQSVKKHKYTNLFSMPHHSDITSHLNFKLFHKILKKNNLNVEKITTQNEFLKKIGILERANILSKKMTFKEKANMYYRLKKLIDSREMGSLFKVLFAQKKGGKFSLGF